MVGEELEGDDLEDGEEQLRGGGDVDGVLDLGGDLAVALDGDGDDAARARGDLLNVAEGRRLNLEDFRSSDSAAQHQYPSLDLLDCWCRRD